MVAFAFARDYSTKCPTFGGHSLVYPWHQIALDMQRRRPRRFATGDALQRLAMTRETRAHVTVAELSHF